MGEPQAEDPNATSVDIASLQLEDPAAELDVPPGDLGAAVRRALTPPPAREPFTLGAPTARTAATATALSVASVPFMIGDTGGGGCASVAFNGAQEANIEHPTLACSRVNISENNSPLIQDRAYFSYRHFHNVSETNLFTELGGAPAHPNDLNVDRFTLGFEKSFWDGLFSLEVRVPGACEMNSDLSLIMHTSGTNLPITDKAAEMGNISVIMKALLLQRCEFTLSGGVAVMIPTADDVSVHGDFDTPFIIVSDQQVPLWAYADVDFDVLVNNDTVNISPFLGWVWTPSHRFFHQGFWQVNVATNPSDLRLRVNGDIYPFHWYYDGATLFPIWLAPIALDIDDPGKLHQQTLMRLNLGFGYWFLQNPTACCLKGLAGMLEFHWTSTLQDAKVYERELWAYDNFGERLPVNIDIGNGLNRVDIINMTLGCVAQFGNAQIINGLVIPFNIGLEKAFDYEYNLQVQYSF
jgi:hypothetical protein